MHADFVLTTFSPAMFGEQATMHIKMVPHDEAKALVTGDTKIVATRVSHDRLARNQLPGGASETARYANLKPGTVSLHVHYRGPMIGEDGALPANGVCSYYLIEVEDYVEA